MTRTFTVIALTGALALAALGCGSSSSNGSSESGGGSESQTSGSGGAYGGGESQTSGSAGKGSQTAAAGGMVISVAMTPDLGKVIVDKKGFTVYDFHKDKGTQSSCYGACEKVWPPVTTEGGPQPGNGAQASKLGTTKRKDGTVQVTYAGHPLYTYVADQKPGDTGGNDFSQFGGQWYALKPNGEEAGG